MNEKPSALEANVAHLQADVTDIKGHLVRLDMKFDAKIDGAVKVLDDKITGVANGLDAKINGVAKGLDAKIDGVAKNLDDKIAALDRRLVTLIIVVLSVIGACFSYTAFCTVKLGEQVQTLDHRVSEQYALLLSKLTAMEARSAGAAGTH